MFALVFWPYLNNKSGFWIGARPVVVRIIDNNNSQGAHKFSFLQCPDPASSHFFESKNIYISQNVQRTDLNIISTIFRPILTITRMENVIEYHV